jgi:iron complex outermembrane receptor protein
MAHSRVRLLGAAIPVVVLVGLSTPAQSAQTLVEEILVTAQKREQSMQDVGIAVTAFSGEQIRQLGFQNSIDIVAHTPGMTFGTPTAEGNNANLALRGVALNDFNDNNESPVAVYIDEVYVSAIAGATFQLFDIDRVEVLRGPQGTLFGRNASGGLVQFITVKPASEFEGYAQLTLGENSQIASEAAINVPLHERVDARLSLAQNKFDGYVSNRVPGIDDPNDADNVAGRIQLAVRASDSVDLLFNYHRSEEDSLDGSWQHQSTQQGGATGDVSIPLPPDVVNPNPDIGTCPGCDIFEYRDTDGDPWAGDYDRDGPLRISNDGGSMRADWRLGGDLTLTSVSAWESYNRLFGEDTDLGPFPGVVPTFTADIDQFSQEIRLAGSRERMRWTAGVYYFESEVVGVIDLGAVEIGDGQAPSCRTTACRPPAEDWLIFYHADYDQDTESWAVFGQVEYDLSDALTLILGLRYTDEQRDLELLAVDLVGGNVPGDVFLDFTKATVGDLTQNDSDNWTGKVELDWRPADGLLVHGSISRGVKAAGFNTGLLDENDVFNLITPEQVPFDEETLTSYEIGFKSTLADGRVRLNAAAFYYDYKDFQAFAFANLGQIIFNTDATVNGAEVELVWSPTERIETLFGVSWINEAQAEDIESPNGFVRDRDMVLAPEWQLNTILRYNLPVAGGNLALQWDGFYQTEAYFDIQNHPVSQSDSYSVWNARLIYDSADNRWSVTGWMNNVFEEEYLVYTFDFTASFGYNQLGYGRPRWMGVTAAYRW